ncbi:MAG: gliding motility-associated C-terminal domain-containing protein [Flavobacteriales bacterium]|nr:gliding motility-associated C-terminal domain-containing protein [Flavobacteriales bacterium]
MKFLFQFACATVLLSFQLEAIAQQDCFDAIYVCSSSYVQNSSYSGVGSEQEVPPATTCLGNGEVNSVWYRFTVTSSGSMGFLLNPLNPNDDYDFALFNLSNDSCSGILAGTNLPVSCNYSADPGATGMSANGTGNTNGSSGPNRNALRQVLAGESYALMISNFTSSQTGYSLDFAGTASIADNDAAIPDSINLGIVCNPLQVVLFFTEEFNCSSIAGASEIVVTGPSAVTIANVTGLGCNDGSTDQLRIRFTSKILVTGTYTITINSGSDGDTFTDGCGNQVQSGTTYTFTVANIGPDVSVSNIVPTSCGLNQGSATAIVSSGTPPYTYSWNTSPTQTTASASNMGPGNYRVTVTDANGCRERVNVTILNDSPFNLSNVTITPVACNGQSNGSAQLVPTGGVTPYTIQWQTMPVQTGQTANNLSGGPVNVIVTDATGCFEQISVTIPQPPAINLSTTVVKPDCGSANGSITATAIGGGGNFAYSWNTNPIQTGASVSGLVAGVYTVTATDQSGCARASTVILTNNFAPNASVEDRIPDCGQGTGQATVVPTSGQAPYSFQWNTNPVQTTATATGLTVGDYFVNITDANNCVQIINIKVDSVLPPQLSLALTQPDCGSMNGEAVASVVNGIGNMSYSWSSSANITDTETGLVEGSYTVTVTDSIGCTDTESFQLNQLPPTSDFTFSNVCEGEEMSFVPQTNSGAVAWHWEFGDGNSSNLEYPSYTYAQPGNYTVSLILSGGCMDDTVTYQVSMYAPPTVDFSIEPSVVTTRIDANFTYTGSAATDFNWYFGDRVASNEQNPSHLFGFEGFYDIQLIAVDANGCSDTAWQTIEVLLQPVIYFPNAFVPEGTPANSTFKGYGIGLVAAELSIFNRWGSLVYSSNDVNEILTTGWDGNYNGKPARQGAYAYKLKASFYNNSSFEKLGTVTLIR